MQVIKPCLFHLHHQKTKTQEKKRKEKVMMQVISPAGLFRVRRKGKKKQMSLLVSVLLP
jgi:hypothetical protein